MSNETAETFELDVKAVIENLPRITDGIEDFMKRKGFRDEIVFDVRLAVDEAVTNIIEHGYQGKEGTIRIRCHVGDQEVVLTIEDSAKPFDILSVKEPPLSGDVEKRQMGGLGIFLIKKKMEQVSYESRDGRNILTMKKKVHHP